MSPSKHVRILFLVMLVLMTICIEHCVESLGPNNDVSGFADSYSRRRRDFGGNTQEDELRDPPSLPFD